MNAISMINLCKRYSGKEVLEKINMTIPPGQVVSLLGRNGAGKTTMMRILYGLITPDSGKSEILGLDSRSDPETLRRKIGYLSEECHLYPWMTGTQLVQFVSPFYPTWDSAHLSAMVKALEIPMDKQVKILSKGARRKLMLALTMAFRPEVLMLDEPLAGLDPVVREQILNTVIHELSERGCTVFLSSHEILEVEKVCDRSAIISNGRLILDMETDVLKSGVRRILLTLTSPVEILPSHPSILSARSRGTELDIVVKDFDESLVVSLTSNLKVKDRKVEGLTLQEIFINLTQGREEKI